MSRYLVGFIVTLAAAATTPAQDAARLRVVIIVDTNDQMGATWGLDGDNVKKVFEAAARKQNVGQRLVVDVLAGAQATPDHILAFLRELRLGADDAVAIYYSGHGGYHRNHGHFLALHAGKLYRSAILDAVAAQKPRLTVLLTDCCSNYAGGAALGEPPAAVNLLRVQQARASAPARKQEPPTFTLAAVGADSIRTVAPPPRPNTLGLIRGVKATRTEPPAASERVVAMTRPRNGIKARWEEPTGSLKSAKGVTLLTGGGPLSLADLAAGLDGAVWRDLFLRQQGVVDINGCKKGALSHGTQAWGGSLFTIALLALQKEKPEFFDANGNGAVEWSEFFPALQRGTDAAAQRAARGKIQQLPEAWRLP